MSVDARTIAVYAARAADYAARFDKEDAPSESRERFLACLPAGGRILDFGCGPGVSARYFLTQGFTVDAIDATPEMVALARDAGVSARVATFDDLAAEAAYDGVWANFSLLHAARDDLPRHFAAIARALRPGGALHVGMKLGEGTKRDALDRRYTFVTRDELAGLFEAAGFAVIAERRFEEAGFAGTVDAGIVMLGRLPDA